MKVFNIKRRIEYLGFNDFWFSVIGIFLISFITAFLFNDMSLKNPPIILLIRWVSCLFFTALDWLIIRAVLIFLRIRFLDFKDDFKRIIFLFFAIIAIILTVDYLGGSFLTLFFRLFDINSTYSMKFKVLLPVIIIVVMDMAIYEAIYYHIRLKNSIREEEQTKQVIIQAQLDTLRNQARPHFLFNSLNTLRDIIDQDPKENAKAFVDNLSDVYRFILESSNANLISLQEELKFVNAYIHIQKERFGDNLQVQFEIEEPKLYKMIVPMSLQLLVENAIKHNVVSRNKPLKIIVETKENRLIIRNKIQQKSTQLPSTGIGLKNIEKRYTLLSNKPVIIDNDNEYFTVSLPLLQISDQK
ncbi:sensor histidine kinase [Tenacibaculum agarivorans]|uniref:sensor histidine kinase n=1 Tax=Tenacibaculum agarivorans TaxID=1908389 RepID=UPI00094B973B|nr:histidine kinase [Tenacibaculum agarivorans]